MVAGKTRDYSIFWIYFEQLQRLICIYACLKGLAFCGVWERRMPYFLILLIEWIKFSRFKITVYYFASVGLMSVYLV
jgi:hypothetical protein